MGRQLLPAGRARAWFYPCLYGPEFATQYQNNWLKRPISQCCQIFADAADQKRKNDRKMAIFRKIWPKNEKKFLDVKKLLFQKNWFPTKNLLNLLNNCVKNDRSRPSRPNENSIPTNIRPTTKDIFCRPKEPISDQIGRQRPNLATLKLLYRICFGFEAQLRFDLKIEQ